MKINWENIHLPNNFKGIVLGMEEDFKRPSNILSISKDFFVPDLMVASDVVLGKLGYGTCSEAIFSEKPLVFVPRSHFNEQEGLEKLMNNNCNSIKLEEKKFLEGNWIEEILQALNRTRNKPVLGVNGGEVAAKAILDLCY